MIGQIGFSMYRPDDLWNFCVRTDSSKTSHFLHRGRSIELANGQG